MHSLPTYDLMVWSLVKYMIILHGIVLSKAQGQLCLLSVYNGLSKLMCYPHTSLLLVWNSAGLRAGWSGVQSQQGLGIFLFTTVSRPGGLFLGVKWPGCEADHSPPSSTDVKNAWIYTYTPQYAFMVWCSVKAHRDNFTFVCLRYRRLGKCSKDWRTKLVFFPWKWRMK
jgi:hypothetical protein